VREQRADEAFLDCLDMAASRGRPACDARQSDRFAPKMFVSLPPGRGLRQKDFQAAMDRLFAAGRIVATSIKGPDRHPMKVIARASA
jgi:hypothetical protein